MPDLAGLAVTRLALAVAVGCVALGPGSGCDDASVSIRFDIPAPYRRDTRAVVLRVLVPPSDPGLAFDCDDIALHEVTPEALQLSQVQEVVAGGDGVDLTGIPRAGPKLFWLEARDAQNQAIAAGCASAGDISTGTTVTVQGEATKIAGFVGSVDNGFLTLGRPLPASVMVTITDTRGLPPPEEVEVQWRIIGLAGAEMAAGQVTTRDRGRTVIELPGAPEIPGPSLLDVSVRWERTPLPPIAGFGPPGDILAGSLPGSPPDDSVDPPGLRTEDLYAVGRIGPAGERGFVALGPTSDPGAVGRPVFAAYYDPGAGDPPFRPIIGAQAIRGAGFALATVTRGNRDIPVVATDAALIELDIQPGGITATTGLAPGGTPVTMVPAGPCQGDSEALLVSLSDPDGNISFVAVDPGGRPVASVFAAQAPAQANSIVGSGCTSGLAGGLTRTVVYGTRAGVDMGDSGLQAIVADTGAARTTQWINFARTVGFTPELADHPAAALAVEVAIAGTSLVRYRLAPLGAGALELERVTEDDLFTFARSMQGGDFDGDGLVDIAAIIDLGDNGRQRRRAHLQIVLGAEHQGERIVGVSDERALRAPHLFVADFNGDGADDILVADRGEFAVIPGVAPAM